MDVPDWNDLVLAAAAFVVACGVLWRQFLRPALRFAARTADAIETLSTIAEEFRPNHGNSLHDRLTRISDDVSIIRGMTEAALLEQQHQAVRLERLERGVPDGNY